MSFRDLVEEFNVLLETDMERVRQQIMANPTDYAAIEAYSRELLRRGDTIVPANKTQESKVLRVQRYRTGIEATELLNAGKRGKQVKRFTVYDFDMGDWHVVQAMDEIVDALSAAILGASSYSDAVSVVKEVMPLFKDVGIAVKFSEETLRGVDVVSPGLKPLVASNATVSMIIEPNEFRIVDLTDKFNVPTIISVDKMGPKKLYAWAQKTDLSKVTIKSLKDDMRKLNVHYHQFSAMD